MLRFVLPALNLYNLEAAIVKAKARAADSVNNHDESLAPSYNGAKILF
jgi:hypothetical protein